MAGVDERQANGDPGVLRRTEQALAELSRSERRVASFLLKNPQEIVSVSVKDLAARLEVSEPTIIRFCRTIGCDGYRDLKIQLAQELAVRQALEDSVRMPLRPPRRHVGALPAQDVSAAVFDSAHDALDAAHDALDRAALGQAAQMLGQARRIFIYGIGGSSALLALEMHNRLFRLSLPCAAYTDSYLQRMSAATLGAGDVAFFISSTGRPRALQDTVELARYYGAKTAGITPKESPLARDLDICLDLELNQAGISRLQPNPMRYAQLYLIDCLAFATAHVAGESALTALDRGRASVASLHGIAPQQPIGD